MGSWEGQPFGVQCGSVPVEFSAVSECSRNIQYGSHTVWLWSARNIACVAEKLGFLMYFILPI